MNSRASEYLTMIDDCEARESRCTDWERGFLDSLRSQLENGRVPSDKQVEFLEACWERVTAKG